MLLLSLWFIGRRFNAPRLLVAALLTIGTVLPAAAASGWRAQPAAASARSAGYSTGTGFTAIWLSCEGLPPGRLSVNFSGFPAGLPLDAGYTVVVSANDIAFLQDTRPVARAGGSYDLARSASFADLAPMISALKKGRSVEVSAPAGRVTLPLTGSGKALSALEAGCGG